MAYKNVYTTQYNKLMASKQRKLLQELNHAYHSQQPVLSRISKLGHSTDFQCIRHRLKIV